MRLFVGIPLEQTTRLALAETLEECKRRLPICRWVPENNLHLTLRFLGDVPEEKLPDVSNWLRLATNANPASSFELAETGWFGSRQRVVFWIGLRKCDWLPSLADALSTPIAGSFPDDREFTAHITLGRYRPQPRKRREEEAFKDYFRQVNLSGTKQETTRVVLFRSHLSGDGSQYEELWSSR